MTDPVARISQQTVQLRIGGPPGAQGYLGWTPVLKAITTGGETYLKVDDWTGNGPGAKPATGYFAADGSLLPTTSGAQSIRGPAGAAGLLVDAVADGDTTHAVTPNAVFDWGYPKIGGTLNGPIVAQPYSAATSSDWIQCKPTDYGTGKPYLAIFKTGVAATWNIGLWDGTSGAGIINFTATSLQHLGATMWDAVNDGSGSGLDADMLRGKYADSSANANTIAARDGAGDVAFRYVYCVDAYASSDRKLKDDIRPLERGLTLKAKPRRFTLRSNGEERFGLIYQDVKKIAPESTSKTGKYGAVDYGSWVAPLIVDVQWAHERADKAEARADAAEARLAELERRLTAAGL